METVNKSKIMVLVVAFLIMVNVFAMPDSAYAAYEDLSNVNENAVEQMDAIKGQFSLDVKSQSVLAGSEVEGVVSNTFANMIFSFQKSITILTIRAYSNMAGGDSDHIGIFERLLESNAMGMFAGLFDLHSVTGIVSLAIAVALVSALFALLRMNISDMASKLAKFFIIFILATAVIGHGATIFNAMNEVVKTASNDITTSLNTLNLSENASRYDSVEDILWDVGVVTPWKILQFGTTTTANGDADKWGTPPTSLAPEMQNSLAEKGQSNAKEALKNLPKNTVAGAYIRASADTSTGYRKEVADKAWKTDNKTSTRYEENEDGGYDKKEDLVEEGSGTYNIGSFAPRGAQQTARLGETVILFLLVLIVCLVTLLASVILLAIKIFAFIVFFMGPIILVFAWLSPEGMQIVKRWIMFLGVVLLGSLVCQILLTIYVLIIGAILGGSNITSIPALFSTLLVLVALILAIRYGGKPLLRIIAPQTSRKAKAELRQDQMWKAMQGDGAKPGGFVDRATTAGKALTGNPRAMSKMVRDIKARNEAKNEKANEEAAKWHSNDNSAETKRGNKEKVNEELDKQRGQDGNLGDVHTGSSRQSSTPKDISAGAAEQVRRDKEIAAKTEEARQTSAQSTAKKGMSPNKPTPNNVIDFKEASAELKGRNSASGNTMRQTPKETTPPQSTTPRKPQPEIKTPSKGNSSKGKQPPNRTKPPTKKK